MLARAGGRCKAIPQPAGSAFAGPARVRSGRRRVVLGERLRARLVERRAAEGPEPAPLDAVAEQGVHVGLEGAGLAGLEQVERGGAEAVDARAGRFAREGGERACRRDPDPVGAASAEGGEQRRGPADAGVLVVGGVSGVDGASPLPPAAPIPAITPRFGGACAARSQLSGSSRRSKR